MLDDYADQVSDCLDHIKVIFKNDLDIMKKGRKQIRGKGEKENKNRRENPEGNLINREEGINKLFAISKQI